MKLGQLNRKIRKEFAKSPAKTIILIALCPVALYFLVPLFLPTRPQVDEAQRAKVIAPDFFPSATSQASASPVPSFGPEPSWTELNDWIEADWRSRPGTIAENQRNPFQPPIAEVEVEVATAALESVPHATVTQEDIASMGFKLTGTLVGRNSRSATINGRRYLAGETVTPMARGDSATAGDRRFVLQHVGPRHAILEGDGARFRLDLLPTQPLENGITILRRPANSSH